MVRMISADNAYFKAIYINLTERTRSSGMRDSAAVLENRLRRLDSNQRPPGYEPDELPLLHAACVLYRVEGILCILISKRQYKRLKAS